MTKTPGLPDAPGGRPQDLPPTPQCLFPPDIKTGPAVAPADCVGGGIDDSLLDSILPVLATTWDEQDVRERLSPPLVRGVRALQGTHSAGWITTPEYEEALLKLFTSSQGFLSLCVSTFVHAVTLSKTNKIELASE